MKPGHFEMLRPLCPVCRQTSHADWPLTLAGQVEETAGDIRQGILHCSNSDCRREYPIIDGIPLILADLRSYVSGHLLELLRRNDLTPALESLLGDCCGPASAFDQHRQLLSCYAWSHYHDCDPAEKPLRSQSPGNLPVFARQVVTGLKSVAADTPPGPWLDVGCAVGRGSFELAELTGQPVLGIDLNFGMLRLAREVLQTGQGRYPRRRVGVVYDTRAFAFDSPARELVDFWACDVLALPFRNASWAGAISLNVLDSISSPRGLLQSLANALRPGAPGLLSCPYDWSSSVTPLESWLGGHSQRSEERGSSEPVLRMLLTPGAHPGSLSEFEILHETELPWVLRWHDRSVVHYETQVVVVRRVRC